MIDERKNIDQWFDEDWDDLSSLKAMIGDDIASDPEGIYSDEPRPKTRAQLQADNAARSKASRGKGAGAFMSRRGSGKQDRAPAADEAPDDVYFDYAGQSPDEGHTPASESGPDQFRMPEAEPEYIPASETEGGIAVSYRQAELSDDGEMVLPGDFDELAHAEAPSEKKREKAGKEKLPKEKRVKQPRVKKQREPKPPREKKPGESIPFIVMGSFAVIALALMLIFGSKITNSMVNLPNVYVGENFVGGLTAEQTMQMLRDNKWDETMDGAFTVKLPGGISYDMGILEAGAKHDAAACAGAAFAYGHDRGILGNLFTYLTNLIMPMDVNNAPISLDEVYIKECLDKGLDALYLAVDSEEYTIDLEKKCIDMLKGAGQIKLDEDQLMSLITASLKNGIDELDYTTPDITVTMPDFKALLKELDKEPVSAKFDDDFNVVDDIKGYVFDADRAEELWEKAGLLEELNIPLTVNEPEVTGDDLRALLFRDVLGSQTTYYTWSVAERINNINIAADKINGVILKPGEVFSYNDTIGQRTEAAGFKPAGAYDDGEVVQELGGGICQVSSTLYSATLYARIETVTRTNHYFKVDYLDYGMDATVSWPSPDFKFRNNTEYPIKIVAECDNENRCITVSIVGTDFEHYTCKLENEFYTVTEDYSYDGKVYGGVPVALSIVTYRTVYDPDGNVVKRELLNVLPNGDTYMDVYYKHKEDIIAGLVNFPIISGGEDPAEGAEDASGEE